MSIIGAVSLTDKTGIFLGSVNLSNLNSDANSVLYSVNGSDIKGDTNILKFEEDIKKLTVKESMSYVSASPIGVETAINENEFFTGVIAQNKDSSDGSSTHLLITNDQGTDYSFYGGFDMFSSNSTIQDGQFGTMPNALGISSQSSSIVITPNSGNSENQNQNNNIMLTYDNGTKAHIINNAGQLIVGANNPNYSGNTYGGDNGGVDKVLSTDGNGLKWITPSAGITISNQANTFIPFCTSTSNSLDCDADLNFNNSTNTLSVPNVTLTNINGVVYNPYTPGSSIATGNLYYFDATTNASTGSLLSIPTTTAQTTTTYTWTNNNNPQLICTFITPATTLATQAIGSGNWDAELYVSTSNTSPQADFFFKYYYVDADGTSNKTLIKDGSNDTTLCGSTSTAPPALLLNSLYITGLTLPSTTNRIIAELYFIVPTGNPNGKSATVYFRNGTLSHLQTTLLGFPSASFQNNSQTANNIVLASGSNVLDSSSNLTFDGTRLSLYSTNPLTIGRGNNASSAATNTAIGYQSLNAVTSGVNNTCYGYNSGVALTTQSQSTIIGSGASTTATGSNNVAVGFSSRAGSSSVSVGSAAYCTESSVSVGSSCGRAAMSGPYNVLMGFTCGNAITSGNGNVCVGSNNGFNITSGTNNTLIGISAGSTQTTQSNNTVCGYFSDVGAYSNSAIFGANISSVVNGSNQVQIGNSATTVYTYATATRASDARDKAEIRDTQFGLDFISKLRPRDYKFDYREEYQELKQIKDESGNIIGTEFVEYPRDGSKKRNRYHCGLIAQELKETMDELNTDFAGYIDFQYNDPGLNVGEFNRLTVKYDELICPLIKAIQELKLKNEQLEERIKALEK